ncbi:MAG TPA: ABC transporter ATP-binding protein [Actinomycetota bacterium]|nr:ABC transporter ATP-binding protein [Actinomycetota bacterium]
MLRLQDVRVAYEEPVLRGVDLDVAAGEIVCILGPSGGGKSTLLRAVAGLVPAEGVVEVAGVSMAGVPPHRRGVGMMFQHDLLFPHLDVAGNVGFGLRPADPRRVDEMLALVGLTGLGPRATDTLSGGQAQRVALARALAPQPRVLLLDEPFGALDAVLKAELVLEVQLLLRELGMTVLAVTHDRQEAFTLADRVAVLRDGRLVQVGTPDHLWNDPSDTYVARLVGLSVLEERAYRPEDIRVAQDGPWPAVVTGSTFRDGHYLVSARVGEVPVVFVSAQPREAGAHVRLAT